MSNGPRNVGAWQRPVPSIPHTLPLNPGPSHCSSPGPAARTHASWASPAASSAPAWDLIRQGDRVPAPLKDHSGLGIRRQATGKRASPRAWRKARILSPFTAVTSDPIAISVPDAIASADALRQPRRINSAPGGQVRHPPITRLCGGGSCAFRSASLVSVAHTGPQHSASAIITCRAVDGL
jgi:hypothetical protein